MCESLNLGCWLDMGWRDDAVGHCHGRHCWRAGMGERGRTWAGGTLPSAGDSMHQMYEAIAAQKPGHKA